MEWIAAAIIVLFLTVIARCILTSKKLISSPGLAIFITGCDTGIGNYLAKYFNSIGCDVYAGCWNPNSTELDLPDSVTVVPLDVTREQSVHAAVSFVRESLEKKDKSLWAIINNAGVCVYGEFEWQTWNHCQKQVNVNLVGTMRVTKAFIPLLRKAKGRIITITSVNGSIAYPGLSVYSATKFALEGFSNALRLELHRMHGIRVILIQPGDFARLTSIMSQHRQNALEMWEAMSEEDRNEFGSFFRLYHSITMKTYGLTSPARFEDSPLLQNVDDAVRNVNPEVKYTAAAIQYRIFYQLMTIMPVSWSDAILNKITKILYASYNENDLDPSMASLK